MDWKRPDSFLSRPTSTSVRVLILTTFELDEYVFEALRSGASGFLLKDTEPEDLLRAVRWSRPARPCCRRASPGR